MPACCMPDFVFHAIRSLRRWSVISPSHCRRENQIFSSHLTTLSLPSSLLTLSTRCMNFGNSSNFVHSRYATSTGTATSVQRWIGSRRVLPCGPPPPPPPPILPSAAPATLPSPPPWPPPVRAFFAPSAPFSPSSSASSCPFCSTDELRLRIR